MWIVYLRVFLFRCPVLSRLLTEIAESYPLWSKISLRLLLCLGKVDIPSWIGPKCLGGFLYFACLVIIYVCFSVELLKVQATRSSETPGWLNWVHDTISQKRPVCITKFATTSHGTTLTAIFLREIFTQILCVGNYFSINSVLVAKAYSKQKLSVQKICS